MQYKLRSPRFPRPVIIVTAEEAKGGEVAREVVAEPGDMLVTRGGDLPQIYKRAEFDRVYIPV